MSFVEQAEQAGFDLTLMEENLRCTHEQRALNHQQALALALELARAGKELSERTQQAASSPDPG
jgi:hypothetical protein